MNVMSLLQPLLGNFRQSSHAVVKGAKKVRRVAVQSCVAGELECTRKRRPSSLLDRAAHPAPRDVRVPSVPCWSQQSWPPQPGRPATVLGASRSNRQDRVRTRLKMRKVPGEVRVPAASVRCSPRGYAKTTGKSRPGRAGGFGSSCDNRQTSDFLCKQGAARRARRLTPPFRFDAINGSSVTWQRPNPGTHRTASPSTPSTAQRPGSPSRTRP